MIIDLAGACLDIPVQPLLCIYYTNAIALYPSLCLNNLFWQEKVRSFLQQQLYGNS